MPGWISSVAAVAHTWLAGPGGQAAPPVRLVNFAASNGQVLSHNDMPTTIFNVSFELSASVPPGNGAVLELNETIMLHAVTPNGHAYIEGSFTWQPVNVTMREGCRRRTMRQRMYWGSP